VTAVLYNLEGFQSYKQIVKDSLICIF